jgi:hypothetical protein
MTEISFGPYEPDSTSVETQKTVYVKNVVPKSDGYGPVPDLVSFTQALPSRCLGFFTCVDSANTVHVFGATATKLYKLDSATRAWADVSKSGSYSVSDRDFWDFDIFGSQVIAVANANNPQVFTLGSSAAFADLGGTPPQARRVNIIGDFVVLTGLTANPSRIQWSGINNATQWTPGTNSSDYQDFPDGGYVRGVGGGEFGLVFQDTAIRRMIFNPSGTEIFDFSRVSEDRGLYMPYSLAKSHQSMFFFAADGFYRVDSTGGLTPIGSNRNNQTFINDADLTSPRYMMGTADPLTQRIVWVYKSKANTNPNILDKKLFYDWSLDRWSYAEANCEFLDQASPLSTSLESLDALVAPGAFSSGYSSGFAIFGGIDSLPFSLDSYVSTTQPKLAAFGIDHALGFFEGPPLEAIVDTSEGAIGEGQRLMVRGVAPISDATSAYVSVQTRERLKDIAITKAETALGATGYCPQRVSGRFLTAKVRIPAGVAWTFARGVEVDSVQVGFR